MPYRQAITMIDELPPMVQLAPKTPPYPQGPPNRFGLDDPNKYYEEAIQKHPTVQSKIRPTDPNPLSKYEETVEDSRKTFKNESDSEYPRVSRPRASVGQNYMTSNMIPREEEQHLPIAAHVPIHYTRPMARAPPFDTYPVVENLEQISCGDIANHIKNCPICKQLYINIYVVIGIIIVLVIIIIYLMFKLKGKRE
jgi:hypothetical protein